MAYQWKEAEGAGGWLRCHCSCFMRRRGHEGRIFSLREGAILQGPGLVCVSFFLPIFATRWRVGVMHERFHSAPGGYLGHKLEHEEP